MMLDIILKEDFDGVSMNLIKIIGIDRIKVLHINDSKNARWVQKRIDMKILDLAHIGFEALNYIVHHPQLENVPKILETPYVGEDKNNKKPPYKHEIEMLRNKKFDENVLEKIMNAE